MTRRLIAAFAASDRGGPVDEAGLNTLTAREREVLALVGRGLTNDEIGERLVISPATVRTHVGHILTRLDARDRVQLVVLAALGAGGPGGDAARARCLAGSRRLAATTGLFAVMWAAVVVLMVQAARAESSHRPISRPALVAGSRISE